MSIIFNFKGIGSVVKKDEISKEDNLKMSKLLNQIFKSFPNSPKQLKLRKELNDIRIKNGLKPISI